MDAADCKEVVISHKAYLSMLAETYERVGTETGGIFLGRRRGGIWYVIESLDPGPNSIFTPSYFEYDTSYVNHAANKTARFYRAGLELLGLWHRHPGSFDAFSSTDDGTHGEYLSEKPQGIISCLVNLDPLFRMTMYYVSNPLRHTRVPVKHGDNPIPPELLALKDVGDFMSPREVSHTAKPPGGTQAVANNNGRVPHEDESPSLFRWVARTVDRQKQRYLGGSPTTKKDEQEPAQNVALEMLDTEMQYLDAQTDYRCKISMRDSEITVDMIYVGTSAFYPARLEIILGYSPRIGSYAVANGQQQAYEPDFIRKYIQKSVHEIPGNRGRQGS